MSQMTCSGRGPASAVDQLGGAVGWCTISDQPPGPVPHRVLDAGEDPRGERPADDVRVGVRGSSMAIIDPKYSDSSGPDPDDDPRRRAEDLGMPAGMEDVVVAGDRPVPRALVEAVLHELRLVRHRRFAPQRGERAVAQSSSSAQKSQDQRLTSDSGTSGGAENHRPASRYPCRRKECGGGRPRHGVSLVAHGPFVRRRFLHLRLEHVSSPACSSSRTLRSWSRNSDQ